MSIASGYGMRIGGIEATGLYPMRQEKQAESFGYLADHSSCTIKHLLTGGRSNQVALKL